MSVFDLIWTILFVIIIGGSLVGTIAIILTFIRASDDWFREREHNRRKDWIITHANVDYLKDLTTDELNKQREQLNVMFKEPS